MRKILNFRTLAKDALNRDGKKIKPDTIFRSGVLTYATKKDIGKIESFGIKNIYDFRNEEEQFLMAPLSAKQFKTHSFDILEKVANANAKVYLNKTKKELDKGVIDLYSKDFVNTEKYSGVIESVLRQDAPEFLFHCTAGKDRTGIFGAILMMILDFDMDEIRKEYLTLSKRSIRVMRKQMLQKAGVRLKDVDIKKFKGILGVFPEFIDAYLNSILNKHSSIENYLEERVGVTPEIKTAFKEKYLI